MVSVGVTRPLADFELQRNFYATSSCGICGKASLEAIETRCAPVAEGPVVDASVLLRLPDELRARAERVRPHRRPARGGACSTPRAGS